VANKSDVADIADLNSGLIDFIQASPTPYHAVRSLTSELDAAGFVCLDESEPW